MEVIEYGLGGFDSTKPNGNVVNVITVPDPPPLPPSPVDVLQAQIDALTSTLVTKAVLTEKDATDIGAALPADVALPLGP